MTIRRRFTAAATALALVTLALPAAAQPGKAAGKSAPAANLMTPVATLVAGKPVTGTLAEGDSVLDDGTYADVYAYRGRAGERVTIDYGSRAFDTFLTLSLGGSSFAVDDDGAGRGTDSRITVQLPVDGTYEITANALRRGMSGTYTLSLASTPPTGPVTQDWGRVYPGRGRPNERYALVVGVGRYPTSLSADLDGPVADARNLRRVLVERYGFRPENVVTLTDSAATREGILEAARRHLGQAGPTGLAVFYYSGHGTRLESNVAARDDEPDGRDEALLVWGRDGQGSLIVDDEIGALSDGLRAGRALFILDACHSGTGLRDAGGFSKFMPFEQLAGNVTVPPTFAASGRRGDASGADLDPAGSAGGRKRLLLAASADSEVSWISRGAMTPGAGRESVFTHYLVRELDGAGAGETFAAMNARIRQATMRYTKETHREVQTPQAEGRHLGESVRRFLGAP